MSANQNNQIVDGQKGRNEKILDKLKKDKKMQILKGIGEALQGWFMAKN